MSLPTAFHRLAWSNLLAQAAEQIGLVAAPLVAVTLFAAGPRETGLIQMVQTLPFLLFSLPAGILADRVSRPMLLWSGEAVRALALLAVPLLVLSGTLSWPLLAALGGLGAMGTMLYSVAAPSYVPAIVPASGLGAANGRLELARSVAFVGGPALGGLLVGWTGGQGAFALAGGLSVVAVGLLFGLREAERPQRPQRSPLSDLKEGAAFVFAHPLLRPMLVVAVFFNTATFVLHSVYVVYAVQHLHLSETGVGLTLAAYGTGMVLGALTAPKLMRLLPFGLVILIGPCFGLTASAVMALSIIFPYGWVAGLSFFLIGFGPIMWTISTMTLRQVVTPKEMLGRVSALILTATYGARPLGAALGAFIGGHYGLEACLITALVGFFLQWLVVVLSAVPRLKRLPDPIEG